MRAWVLAVALVPVVGPGCKKHEQGKEGAGVQAAGGAAPEAAGDDAAPKAAAGRRPLATLPLTAELPAGAEIDPLPAKFASHPTVSISMDRPGAGDEDDLLNVTVVHDPDLSCEMQDAVASMKDGADGDLIEAPEEKELAHGFALTGSFLRPDVKGTVYRFDHCDEDLRFYCSSVSLRSTDELETVRSICASIRAGGS